MLRTVLAASTVALAATGLVTVGTASAATPLGRPIVRISVTKDHHVRVPATTHPGIAHLRMANDGLVIVIEAKHGTSSRSRAASGLSAGNPRHLLKNFRLIAILTPGDGAFARLGRGTYYLADADADRITASKLAVMTVTGSLADARLPKSGNVVVSSGRDLHTPGTVQRSRWLHLQNRSSSLALLTPLTVAEKTTYKQLHAVVEHPTYRKIFALAKRTSERNFYQSFYYIGPGSGLWVRVPLSVGREIAAVSFVEHDGDTSVLRRGQVRVFKVS